MTIRNGLCTVSMGILIVMLAGCAAIGPPRVERDRIEYNLSLTDSWKRQILLNIVKIRYVEPIFFMDVGEIVAAYSLETGGSVGASRTMFDHSGTGDSTLFEFGGAAKYTDRPTITYRPLTGTAFFRGVMSPMPLRNVFMSIESGASARFFFSLGVRSINGLRNEMLTPDGYRAADPGFVRVVELVGKLQAVNALHVTRGDRLPSGFPLLRLTFRGGKDDFKTAARVAELKDLLGLDAKADSYALGFGGLVAGKDCVMLQTYSLAQVLAAVSGRVDMPADDVSSHRAAPGLPATDDGGLFRKGMVLSGKIKPEGTFASVQYRGNWFWIDDHDLTAKKVFSFIMLAFTLMDKNQQETQLQLTVPTQ